MEVVIRLVLSVIAGSVIGLERELNNHPAGFRTHILVCTGATLITLISVFGFESGDPGRVAAQIVSGIGFLGAGTILREGANIRGLTTAASLWSVAGVGMAIGTGFYLGAIIATVLIVIVLLLFTPLERRLLQGQYHSLDLTVSDVPGQLGRITTKLGEMDVSIKNIQISSQRPEKVRVEVGIKTPGAVQIHDVVNNLADLDGVYTIKFVS